MKKETPLHAVAAFEAAKGLAGVLAAVGLLCLPYLRGHHLGDAIARTLHWNLPLSHLHAFVHGLSHLGDSRLQAFAGLALLYATVRFIEAWGLWRAKAWAEWFAFASGAVYLPFELYEMVRNRSGVALMIFVLNAFIVLYLAGKLRRRTRLKIRGSEITPGI